MELKRPLLSVCIPTYNRAALLVESLQAIIAQWEADLTLDQRDLVEIIVSDNKSPDDTLAVVSRIAAEHSRLRLRLFPQPENKGADANIWTLIGLAEGAYVYLVSDDDILLPGALTKLLALIQAYPEAAAFHLNTKSFLVSPDEQTRTTMALKSDTCVSGGDACLRFLGTWITFVSALTFRRDLVAGHDYSDRIGTDFLQAYLFLDILSGKVEMVATAQPFLAVRGNNGGGYNFFEYFVSRFAELMRYARERGYSPKAIRAVLFRHLTRYVTSFVLTFKMYGAAGRLQPDFRDGRRRLFAVYGPHPYLVFGLLPLMSAPRSLIFALRAVTRTLQGRRISDGQVL